MGTFEMLSVILLGMTFLLGFVSWYGRGLEKRFDALQKRVSKKQDDEMCAQLHKEIERELARGRGEFSQIKELLETQAFALATIDTNLRILVKDYKGPGSVRHKTSPMEDGT